MIPAVRALIGPERELKAGWFEKVRWLRQLHARICRRRRQEKATETVLKQAEMLAGEWAG